MTPPAGEAHRTDGGDSLLPFARYIDGDRASQLAYARAVLCWRDGKRGEDEGEGECATKDDRSKEYVMHGCATFLWKKEHKTTGTKQRLPFDPSGVQAGMSYR